MTEQEKPLMAEQMEREFEVAHRTHRDPTPLLNTLGGIASCATQCRCCQMHNEMATEALEAWYRGGR